MNKWSPPGHSYETQYQHWITKLKNHRWYVDRPLLTGLVLLSLIGLFILYSASNANLTILTKQALRLALSFTLMLVFAQIPPKYYQQWSPLCFAVTLTLLLAVLLVGKIGQGAQRWLVLSAIRFQPSEIMKLSLPMLLAWYLSKKPLPPSAAQLSLCVIILTVPVLLTLKEPDLGTAVIIGIAGLTVLLFAGIAWQLVIGTLLVLALSSPILWHLMHTYQKERLLNFLNPERDPLGSGYHIIQSKIAIGSGGLLGKGWLKGTQSHLAFLPAHATDFIFAVSAEELGFVGATIIIILLFAIFYRCLHMSAQLHNHFSRLLCASLSVTFILSALINIGMVTGLLPVVGIPLPLISYGGSAMLTYFASFGIIMSFYTHKNLYSIEYD